MEEEEAKWLHLEPSWLVKVIKKVYDIQNLPIPGDIRAHSTKAVATSWVTYCRVSPETICRAATWSSRHTFMSHYRVDSAQLSTVELFGPILLPYDE